MHLGRLAPVKSRMPTESVGQYSLAPPMPPGLESMLEGLCLLKSGSLAHETLAASTFMVSVMPEVENSEIIAELLDALGVPSSRQAWYS